MNIQMYIFLPYKTKQRAKGVGSDGSYACLSAFRAVSRRLWRAVLHFYHITFCQMIIPHKTDFSFNISDYHFFISDGVLPVVFLNTDVK